MKVSIIIPAYNEEKRIEKTLQAYYAYAHKQTLITFEFVVVLNGCTDNTYLILQKLDVHNNNTFIINLPQSGKGLAIKAGFLDALMRPNDLIGFVDADMATQPEQFHDLIMHIQQADGIIASRYMQGAYVYPPRPRIKRWGSKLIYEPLVHLLFGLKYHDFQCGAKLFKRHVIEKIASSLSAAQWTFDIELLYLCKKYEFVIKEIPTIWYDQTDSKLNIRRSGLRMLGSVVKLRLKNSPFKIFLDTK